MRNLNNKVVHFYRSTRHDVVQFGNGHFVCTAWCSRTTGGALDETQKQSSSKLKTQTHSLVDRYARVCPETHGEKRNVKPRPYRITHDQSYLIGATYGAWVFTSSESLLRVATAYVLFWTLRLYHVVQKIEQTARQLCVLPTLILFR